jgi:hypothetical protein
MADDAKTAASQLRMLQTTLPLAALVLGLVLIVLGMVLLARRPASPTSADEPAPETRPADAL